MAAAAEEQFHSNTTADVLSIAHVTYHTYDEVDLKKLLPSIQGYYLINGGGCSNIQKKIKTDDDDDKKRTREISQTALMILDADAIRHFQNWNCQLKFVKWIYPYKRQECNPWIFFMPLNDIYDYNPNLLPKDIEANLNNILKDLITAHILQKDDFEVKIYFKKYSWFGFVNFNPDTVTIRQLAFTMTWLCENVWSLLAGVPENEKMRVFYKR